jgi:hypothetical protein
MEHNFSTKEDVISLKIETQKELQAMRFEFRKELQEIRHNLTSLEQKMTIKLGLMQASSLGIFIALVKFF